MPSQDLPPTLIVGGGIGGLTAAFALSKLGTEVRVVEHAESFDRIGAGIGIQANATAIFRVLGIRLPAEDTIVIGAVEVIDHRGRVLNRGNADEILPDPPSVNIHRADLHRALLDACKDVPIETGRPVRRVKAGEDETVVEFEDGRQESAELVIGADGAHSVVRASILHHNDRPLRYTGQTCWRFALEAPDLVPEVSVERWTPGRIAGVMPLSRGRIYVYLVKVAERGTPGPGTNTREVVQQHFLGIDKSLDAVLERLDDSVPINHDDLCDREEVNYGAGRVTLIGDAAHPMTPNAGQGAGTAIEDAAILALLLPELAHQVDALPAAMDQRRRKRVRAMQRLAWRIGRVGVWSNPIARGVRNLGARLAPRKLIDSQARALWQPGIDIAEELRKSGRFT
jgi:2-polyprenyl-6-methoxyphenol hydroxylase-like FAD-dependent oxidoreductase